MTDRLAELEGKVAELAAGLRGLEERLAAVEHAPARAPAARAAGPRSSGLDAAP